jgi:hypothetical protein
MRSTRSQIFLLSPANCAGIRARMVMSGRATFDLALRLRSQGAPVGEVFAFLSGLYFRGKLAYARAFARPPDPASPISGAGAFVITPAAGLHAVDTVVKLDTLRAFAQVDVAPDNPTYRKPLQASARVIASDIGSECDVVLLGSIASSKYVEVLQVIFGNRLLVPEEFVGRGDMSRGGLMLRSVAAGKELRYIPVAGAVRRGRRPPKLDPSTRVRLT